MTENEAIELHIAENLHRIETIEEFLRTNSDADDKECKKNIQILTKVNGALQEIQQYRAIGTIEQCKKSVDVRNQVTEIVNSQLIAGKNNYKEIYNSFYEIVDIIQDNY